LRPLRFRRTAMTSRDLDTRRRWRAPGGELRQQLRSYGKGTYYVKLKTAPQTSGGTLLRLPLRYSRRAGREVESAYAIPGAAAAFPEPLVYARLRRPRKRLTGKPAGSKVADSPLDSLQGVAQLTDGCITVETEPPSKPARGVVVIEVEPARGVEYRAPAALAGSCHLVRRDDRWPVLRVSRAATQPEALWPEGIARLGPGESARSVAGVLVVSAAGALTRALDAGAAAAIALGDVSAYARFPGEIPFVHAGHYIGSPGKIKKNAPADKTQKPNGQRRT
jgi:hypothetical protein